MKSIIWKLVVCVVLVVFFAPFFASPAKAGDEGLTKPEVESIVDKKLSEQSKKDSPDWLTKHHFKPIFLGFLQYSLDLNTSAHQRRAMTKWDNGFDLTRLYFGFDLDLTNHIAAQVKGDINARTAAGAEDDDFDIFLKTGFLTFGNFESVPGFSITAGLHDLPWIGYVDKVWGYRVQGQNFTDYERYLASTDVGFSTKYEFPEKWGDLHFSFVNGTGFNNGPENDNYKDLHLRTTLRPLSDKNFFVSALGVLGFRGSKTNDHERLAGLVGYKDDKHGTIAGEILYAIDPASFMAGAHPSLVGLTRNAKALGFSGFGELKAFWFSEPWNRFSLIGRLDFLDPDRVVANNYHYHGVEGVAYTLNKHFKFVADHDWSSYVSGAGQRGNNTFFIHVEAKL